MAENKKKDSSVSFAETAMRLGGKTEEEAKETVKYYVDNKEKLGYDSPAHRKAPDNEHWVVYNQSTKKVLKSINWKPVDLSGVCK